MLIKLAVLPISSDIVAVSLVVQWSRHIYRNPYKTVNFEFQCPVFTVQLPFKTMQLRSLLQLQISAKKCL